MQERLTPVFSAFSGWKNELVPVLQAVQKELGYLPEDAMLEIAKFTGVPESRVYAVATFYTQFRFTPKGRHHVMVCRGTACHVRGGAAILAQLERDLGIKENETSADLAYSLETVACIGACGLAPTMVIDGVTYGRLTPKRVPKILDDIRARDEEGQHE